jgi:hypothetical protein
MRTHRQLTLVAAAVVWLSILMLTTGLSASEIKLSRGQTVYVPIYSHIYSGDRERPFLLTAILSVRNTDPIHSITISTIDYYSSDGKLIKKYIDRPVELKPLASARYIVPESDSSGGSGANFIVKWKADSEVNNVIVEGVMIGAKMQQGISFVSRGQVIKE